MQTIKELKVVCPYCESRDIEYSNYEWFCNACGEEWDRWGQDTK